MDFTAIMGKRLPNAIYYMMANGFLSAKLPQVIARSEWMDKTAPLVDTKEYR